MFYSRIKNLWPWLADAKFVWLALGVNALALVISLRPGTNEPLIRMVGLALQLFGIASVIWGISETRALFGHASIARKATDWLRRFPLLRRDAIVLSGCASVSMSAGNGRAFGTHGPGPNSTVESRLTALESNINTIHDRISATQNEIDQERQKSADALKQEEMGRRQEDAAIREKLEVTGTGGVHISAIGASWLFVGVILSTAAPEIAALLK